MSTAEASPAPLGFEEWLSALRDGANRDEYANFIETHATWIILTRRHAYKIKKAIELSDVCWHALSRRRQACIDEVRLNTRMAPGVYLGVVPLARAASGELRLGGNGVPVEWAVKMRRLGEDRNLLSLIVHDRLKYHDVRALGNALATFYVAAPPETERLDVLCSRLRLRIENAREPWWVCAPNPLRRAIDKVVAQQWDYLDGARSLLNSRVCDGRIVDGHGDLRPKHVFLERQPAIIDCVEYDADRRRRDALDDLSALTMECRKLDRTDLAEDLIETYRRKTGDDSCPHLEAFYRSLHACSRASEMLKLRSEKLTNDTQQLAEATSYIRHAKREVGQIL
jgi:uncharacterized protein